MATKIDLDAIEVIHTPGASFRVEADSLEHGGVPWITGQGGTYRFTEATTGKRVVVPVGAVCAVEMRGDGLRSEAERMASESTIAAAFSELQGGGPASPFLSGNGRNVVAAGAGSVG